MTIYDAAMVIVVVAGMVWGAWRGITWQLASIASLVLGYLVAHPLSAQLAPQFPGEPIVARSLAMLVVYVAVSCGVFVAAWIVRATLRQLKFEAFDRHLGMVLGGLEGALLGLVATLFVVNLAPQSRGPIFSSPSGRVVGQIMSTVGPALPGEFRSVLAPFWGSSESLASDRLGEMPGDPTTSRDEMGGPAGDGAQPSPFGQLLEEGEARIGKAIAETAGKGFQRASNSNGGATERR